MCKSAILACVLLLVKCEDIESPSNTSISLCANEGKVELGDSGNSTAMTVTLGPTEDSAICKLHVTSPSTHLIYVQFIETSPEPALSVNASRASHPCVMSIFLPENSRIPVWKGDLCSEGALTEVDLLTSDIRIVWNPPSNPAFTRGRKFVLTAVGQGLVCKEPGQHTCMRIGWDPMMCVADALLCNGFQNCPKSSTTSDEDAKLCKKSFFAPASLEQLAVELFKKWKPSDPGGNKWLQEKLEQHATTHKKVYHGWREWREKKPESTSTTTTTTAKTPRKSPKATDSISQVLSKYGPWGYLMIGMLICGTVLMFCGLWECCFRRPKSQVDAPIGQTQPTTVLVIEPREESPRPPNYDELDRPPSYSILFPNFKNQNCERDTSASDTGEVQSEQT